MDVGARPKRQNLSRCMRMGIENLNMLVFDGNPYMCKIAKAILSGFGLSEIHTTQNVSQALDVLNSGSIDIALCALDMNPVDGILFTKMVRARAEPDNPYLPIILMTTQTRRRRIVEARNAGVNAIIAKPLRPIDLFSRIRYVVEQPKNFVRTNTYFGPDRRRIYPGEYNGEERRVVPKPVPAKSPVRLAS